MTTRDRILDAAAEVIGRLGLAKTTTREIARVAGFAEATIYKNFRDKEDLVTRVQLERMPSFFRLVQGLPGRVGQGTVLGNLTEFTEAALEHYRQTFPMAASLFAEPRLLAAQREALRKVNGGPHLANDGLAAYLRAEQEQGRIGPEAQPDAAAALLIGACFQRAFLDHFAGVDVAPAGPGAADLARAAVEGFGLAS
ncbi:TetR/AcrR family transcriptional regulator [Longispora albida]|uniref:TetR/AcrR family transcriptional regulator n=1 Tax=Longispora albida TaxID=203523 RepID=UPI0003A07297|nr:TetR/AcrR family transcriptional regulator [Longispora albida]